MTTWTRVHMGRRRRAPRTGLAGVLGFVILAGLLFMAFSHEPAARMASPTAPATPVRELRELVDRADGALEAGNYGLARSHLSVARDQLSRMMGRLEGTGD